MKIKDSKKYSAGAFWGPRRETPQALAARFLKLLGRLQDIDPAFSGWLWTKDDQPVAFDEIKNDLAAAIEARIARSDDGEPEPVNGYYFSVYNTIMTQPRGLRVAVHGGAWARSQLITNDVWISTNWGVVPDPALITFPIFKGAVLAMVESFDAIWGTAFPSDLGIGPVPPYYRLGWISYVGPRFAHLITPPSSAIVERQANGGLLMAATDETFSVANPAHLAAARDILAAVAPLNALPWPPEAGAAKD